MKYYNIKIMILDNYECNGYVVVDNNNLIYGDALSVDGPVIINGKFIGDSVYLELNFENKLVPIEGVVKTTDQHLLIAAKDLKDIAVSIEMVDLDKIKEKLNSNNFRTCANCYYGNYSTNGFEDKIWCENTYDYVTAEHCCDEHLFCDENHEMYFEDYKRRESSKLFKKMFNDKSVR